MRTHQASLFSSLTRIAANFFLQNLPQAPNSQLLLNTVFDEHGASMGVLAQLLEAPASKTNTPVDGIDPSTHQDLVEQIKTNDKRHPAYRTKSIQADMMQTQLLQGFAELLPTGLAILDKDAEAVFVNDGFFKLTTNKSPNEFRSWPESIHSDDYDRVISAYRSAFESRSELRIEFRCASDPARDREVDTWRLFLLKPLSEDPDAGFISAVIDISDIKEAQLAQERAARDAQDRKEQQERFIDMVSHEVSQLSTIYS